METIFDICEVNNTENEIELIGRACADISFGDILITKEKEKLEIVKIYSYKREWKTISAGTSCALIVKFLDRDMLPKEKAKKMQRTVLFREKQEESL